MGIINIMVMKFFLRLLNKLYSHLLCVVLLIATMLLMSCEDDNVGEYKLSGNIESLITDNSYDFEVTNADEHIIFTPYISANFKIWGLSLKQVEYYLDGTLYDIEDKSPYTLSIDKTTLATGKHSIKARMNFVGEMCDDIVREKESNFIVSSSGAITKRHGDFYMNFNYVTNGEYLMFTPELLAERSSEGCAMDEVKYYWDGKLVATETAAPFTLRYLVNEEKGTVHTIDVTITYHNKDNSKLTYNYVHTGYKIYDDNEEYIGWSTKSAYKDYVNGETLSLVARLYKGNVKDGNYSIEFYLDGKLIGRSETFPYTLDHTLAELTFGNHVIMAKMTINGKQSTSEKTITITK